MCTKPGRFRVTCSRFPGRLVLGVHAAVLVVVDVFRSRWGCGSPERCGGAPGCRRPDVLEDRRCQLCAGGPDPAVEQFDLQRDPSQRFRILPILGGSELWDVSKHPEELRERAGADGR